MRFHRCTWRSIQDTQRRTYDIRIRIRIFVQSHQTLTRKISWTPRPRRTLQKKIFGYDHEPRDLQKIFVEIKILSDTERILHTRMIYGDTDKYIGKFSFRSCSKTI